MCSELSKVNIASYKVFDEFYEFSNAEEKFRSLFEDIYIHLYNILKFIFCAINN